MLRSLQLLCQELDWHYHDNGVLIILGQTMSDGATEAHFEDILIDCVASKLLLPLSIARLAVVRRHIHETKIY